MACCKCINCATGMPQAGRVRRKQAIIPSQLRLAFSRMTAELQQHELSTLWQPNMSSQPACTAADGSCGCYEIIHSLPSAYAQLLPAATGCCTAMYRTDWVPHCSVQNRLGAALQRTEQTSAGDNS